MSGYLDPIIYTTEDGKGEMILTQRHILGLQLVWGLPDPYTEAELSECLTRMVLTMASRRGLGRAAEGES